MWSTLGRKPSQAAASYNELENTFVAFPAQIPADQGALLHELPCQETLVCNQNDALNKPIALSACETVAEPDANDPLLRLQLVACGL